MKLILLAALAIFASSAVVPSASAQSAKSAIQARYAAVLRACKSDAARFCPAGSDQASGHNQAICLRPYRSNLALSCRSAVTAAKP